MASFRGTELSRAHKTSSKNGLSFSHAQFRMRTLIHPSRRLQNQYLFREHAGPILLAFGPRSARLQAGNRLVGKCLLEGDCHKTLRKRGCLRAIDI